MHPTWNDSSRFSPRLVKRLDHTEDQAEISADNFFLAFYPHLHFNKSSRITLLVNTGNLDVSTPDEVPFL